MNVLLNLKKESIPIKEIDIEVIYIDNNKSSHFKVVRDSIKIYKEIIDKLKDQNEKLRTTIYIDEQLVKRAEILFGEAKVNSFSAFASKAIEEAKKK